MTDSHDKFCIRCWLLGLKHKLPSDGDWLFPTFSTDCKKCSKQKHQQEDLASQFDSPEKALSRFEEVPAGDARGKLLLEHAEDWTQKVQDIAALQQEKAKSLLGTSSFAAAALFGSLKIIEDDLSHDSPTRVVEIVLFFWACTHVYRALKNAIQAVTRNESVTISTQDFINSLNGEGSDDLDSAYRRLAAHHVSSANQTHKKLLDRIKLIQGGQISFRYGLVFIGILLILHVSVLAWSSQPKSKKTSLEGSTEMVVPVLKSDAYNSDASNGIDVSRQTDATCVRSDTTPTTDELIRDTDGTKIRELQNDPTESGPQPEPSKNGE